jgi:deoxyadenosine/deoxycytidine kinase
MSIIISIEGNIGSGKSTLVDYLKNNYTDKNIVYLQEPVDEWNNIKDENNITILEKFYANQTKYSFAFQMMAYISRLDLLRNSIKNNPNSIIITERSLFTDKYVFAQMLYDSNKMEKIEYEIYNKWFNSMIDLAPLSKVIYLKTEPYVSYNRIKKRNRDGENQIPFEYIKECHEYHNHMIDILNIDKKIIDCTCNMEEDNNLFKKWSTEILDFIKK